MNKPHTHKSFILRLSKELILVSWIFPLLRSRKNSLEIGHPQRVWRRHFKPTSTNLGFPVKIYLFWIANQKPQLYRCTRTHSPRKAVLRPLVSRRLSTPTGFSEWRILRASCEIGIDHAEAITIPTRTCAFGEIDIEVTCNSCINHTEPFQIISCLFIISTNREID